MKVQFESELAHLLYLEVSSLADVSKIKRTYISNKFIWKLWQRVYKTNCGCTRYYLLPDDK
ncbi:MAG: hypothetical protein K5989_01425 [Lachnospiraceae bacterium]|nr:hypothetical protein [Lachnospiraceae bacterium]